MLCDTGKNTTPCQRKDKDDDHECVAIIKADNSDIVVAYCTKRPVGGAVMVTTTEWTDFISRVTMDQPTTEGVITLTMVGDGHPDGEWVLTAHGATVRYDDHEVVSFIREAKAGNFAVSKASELVTA